MSESPTDVSITRVIPAEPRHVFEAWLKPEALVQFMCPTEGTTVSHVSVDARVGGSFLIVMRVGGAELPHRGEYLEIIPYRRLAFTWPSAAASGDSRVTLTFELEAGHQTRLTLRHSGLADTLARQRHESGWTGILARLVTWVGGGASSAEDAARS